LRQLTAVTFFLNLILNNASRLFPYSLQITVHEFCVFVPTSASDGRQVNDVIEIRLYFKLHAPRLKIINYCHVRAFFFNQHCI